MPTLTFDSIRCKGCSLCINACPKSALALDDDLNAKGFHPAKLAHPDKCVGCGSCAIMCPDVVIKVEKDE